MLIVEIDVDQLMLWLIFMLSLTTVVYLFFDVNYFLRMGFTICWTKLFQNKLKIDETAEVYGICVTNDIVDFMPIMGNARYVRELDFARLNYCERTGIRAALMRAANGTVLQSVNLVGHKRPIPIFTIYKITTKLCYWDEKFMYIEHRFVSVKKDIVYAVIMNKMIVIGLNIPKLIGELSGRDDLEKPIKSDLLLRLFDTIDASRSKLQKRNIKCKK